MPANVRLEVDKLSSSTFESLPCVNSRNDTRVRRIRFGHTPFTLTSCDIYYARFAKPSLAQ